MKTNRPRLISRLLALPLLLAAGAALARPDLVVSDIGAPAQAASGGNVSVAYRIRNDGTETAAGIQVGVYLSHQGLVDQGSLLLGTAAVDGLAPGQSLDLAVTGTIPPDLYDGSPYYIGVYADYPHAIDELDEGNNQRYAFFRTSGSVCEADAFENDSALAQARPLHVGDKQGRNLCDGSVDWLYFDAVQGATYVLTTRETSNSPFVKLSVHDAAGAVLASSTASGPQLTWTAPASARYYASVAQAWSTRGYAVSLLTPAADLADVKVDSLATRLVPGGFLQFTDILLNRGSVAAGNFEVGYYLSRDEFISAEDTLLNARAVAGLAPETWDYTTLYGGNGSVASLPLDAAPGQYYLGSLADHRRQVPEFREHNNAAKGAPIEIRAPYCAHDAYENDDWPARATPAVLGAPQAHNHCDDEVDWLSFAANAGTTYIIETSRVGRNAASAVWLYDRDAKTQLTYSQAATASTGDDHTVRIVWQAPASGTYYVKIGNTSLSPPDWIHYGQNTEYTVTVAEQAVLPDLKVRTTSEISGGYSGMAGGTGAIPVYVYNQGLANAGGSAVGIYLSPDWEVTPADVLLTQRETPALAAGAGNDYWYVEFAYPATLAPGVYYLAAIADAGDQVFELNEVNNAARPLVFTILAPPCAPDAYEEDDFASQAKAIQVGSPQRRNTCEDYQDHAYFDVTSSGTYAIETTEVGPNQNMSIEVWNSAGTRLGYSDSGLVDARAAYLELTLATGRYRVLVTGTRGLGSDYTLSVTQLSRPRGKK